MADEDPTVSYSVKELIERLERKVDQFIVILTTKADRTDLELVEEKRVELEARVTDIERRLGLDEEHERERREYRRWLIPAMSGVLLTLVTVLGVLLFHG